MYTPTSATRPQWVRLDSARRLKGVQRHTVMGNNLACHTDANKLRVINEERQSPQKFYVAPQDDVWVDMACGIPTQFDTPPAFPELDEPNMHVFEFSQTIDVGAVSFVERLLEILDMAFADSTGFRVSSLGSEVEGCINRVYHGETIDLPVRIAYHVPFAVTMRFGHPNTTMFVVLDVTPRTQGLSEVHVRFARNMLTWSLLDGPFRFVAEALLQVAGKVGEADDAVPLVRSYREAMRQMYPEMRAYFDA